MKDKNKCVRYDMLVLKMRKKHTLLNIILIKLINSSHPFLTVSRTVISMHTNSKVLDHISHFSSHKEIILAELFSLEALMIYWIVFFNKMVFFITERNGDNLNSCSSQVIHTKKWQRNIKSCVTLDKHIPFIK